MLFLATDSWSKSSYHRIAACYLGMAQSTKYFSSFPEPLFHEEYCSVRVFHKDGKLIGKISMDQRPASIPHSTWKY